MKAARSTSVLLLLAVLPSACELIGGIDDRKLAEGGAGGSGGTAASGGGASLGGGAGGTSSAGGSGGQANGGAKAGGAGGMGGGARLGGATGSGGIAIDGGLTGLGGSTVAFGGAGGATSLGGATGLGGLTSAGGGSGQGGSRPDGGSDAPNPDAPSCVPVPGTGNGLLGDYFSGNTLTSLKVTRLDPTVDFTWSGAPEWNVPADRFSVRWNGQVQPRYSGRYTFYTVSDDGVRLWVNGTLLIDDWTQHSSTEKSGTIDLQAGQRYSLKLEYYQYDGNANVQLGWSSSCQVREVIPSSQLYTPTTECPVPSLGAGTGLSGAYYDNQDLTNLRLSRLDPTVNFTWAAGTSPDPSIAATSFSVRWTGQVQAKYSEPTTFYVTADDGVRLFIDDVPIIDAWSVRQTATTLATVNVAAGQTYNVRLEYFQQDGGGQVQLAWASPCQPREVVPQSQLTTAYAPMLCTDVAVGAGSGLRGEYFSNQTLSGTPVTHAAEAVNFDWGDGAPDGAVSADNFSVRWTGKIMARYTGSTTFHTLSDDGIKVWVAGQLIIDNWSDHQVVEDVGAIKLVAGQLYDIKIEYRDNLEKAVAKLLWYTPCQATEVVPAAYLYPPGYVAPDAGPDAATPDDAADGGVDGP